MKKILILILLFSIIYQGNCQKLILNGKNEIKMTKFSDEIRTFMKSNNEEHPKNCKYFVYVIYVYPFDNQPTCIGYTVSYICNYTEFDEINPQYYFTDSVNLIAVAFNIKVREKSIPDFNLIGITDNKIILDKLIPERKGFFLGTTKAFIYKDCPLKKEIVYYENSDVIPREFFFYRRFPSGVEIKLIKKGSDSATEKHNQ